MRSDDDWPILSEQSSRWIVADFPERFDLWVKLEQPSVELRIVVLTWIFTRGEDPYQGVRRVPGFANLWFGEIPDANATNGTRVTCSYWIEESTRTVRCDLFGSLNPPI